MTSSRKPAEPTSYALEFNAQALKEWGKLGNTIQLQFAKKLKERLENPRVEADKLRDMPATRSSCALSVTAWCMR
jgi:mRNA interferase RelE/StbE